MARFETVTATVTDADGEDRVYEIIADRSTFKSTGTPFGHVKMGSGFIRCQGKRYIGNFGSQPVYAGSEGEVYYAPMSFFDGVWGHCGPNSRGLHTAVTASSGTGKLFAELEQHAAATGLAAAN